MVSKHEFNVSQTLSRFIFWSKQHATSLLPAPGKVRFFCGVVCQGLAGQNQNLTKISRYIWVPWHDSADPLTESTAALFLISFPSPHHSLITAVLVPTLRGKSRVVLISRLGSAPSITVSTILPLFLDVHALHMKNVEQADLAISKGRRAGVGISCLFPLSRVPRSVLGCGSGQGAGAWLTRHDAYRRDEISVWVGGWRA